MIDGDLCPVVDLPPVGGPMTGLPPRVTKAEERINELEKSQTALGVKADLTLNAVYEIRNVLMKGNK